MSFPDPSLPVLTGQFCHCQPGVNVGNCSGMTTMDPGHDRDSSRRKAAFSLLEVVVSLVIIVLMLVCFLRFSSYGPPTSAGIQCVRNLKQIGLAARMWSNDHGDLFPWQASTNKGGTAEFITASEVFRHFLVLSNELASPRILACPKDNQRKPTKVWNTGFGNHNCSYFVSFDADEASPQTILSGDRNLTGGAQVGSLILITPTNRVGWGTNIHSGAGNLGLADGSAQQSTEQSLQGQFGSAFASTTNQAFRFAIPDATVVPRRDPWRWVWPALIVLLFMGVMPLVLRTMRRALLRPHAGEKAPSA